MYPALAVWPITVTLVTALVAFIVMTVLSLAGTQPADRPAILQALADVLRAFRGRGRGRARRQNRGQGPSERR
ncbi:hypothetical protein ABZ820_39395 [Streptomyces diacarni]|uniref:Uncharacterized protein n=1 Tax=Streptomyces diacarni TaxID=2800381 RepID=A0A367ENP0_9ACTN|nr:hypothetical protein DTL70_23240 [Streptomyces diacarni]